ncbi:hypothetical protein ABA45_15425 [Marinobacter psychrophilus]|uniref:Uncharacterized protein n=1 Tax=Marinobacter psychrophilus TaxID=330734 RepID=A0A0H4I7C0_9GAMM|nr:hypothetical protein ABA45_15425 [Marinobacter psychrophilus]
MSAVFFPAPANRFGPFAHLCFFEIAPVLVIDVLNRGAELKASLFLMLPCLELSVEQQFQAFGAR